MNVKKLRLLIIAGSGLMVMGSCGTSRQVSVPQETAKMELSESKEREYQYALTEATKQKIFGNLRQAVALYQKCLEVNPASDVANYQLGNLYMRAGNMELARDYSRRAVILNDSNYWYNLQLASLYNIAEERDSSIHVFEKMVSIWPEKVVLQYELARNYAENNQVKEAIDLLNRIERENGISEQVNMFKEQLYMRTGRVDKAIEEIKKLIGAQPEEVRYLGLLAELYSDAGMNKESLETYKKVFELDGDNGIAQLSLAEHYKHTGEEEKRMGMLDKAISNKTLRVEKKLEAIISMITNAEDLNRYAQEIEEYIEELSAVYPDEYRIQAVKGDFLVKQGRQEEAIDIFEQLYERKQDNYFVLEQLVFLYNAEGEHEKVYEKCSEGIRRFPERPVLYLFKGNAESIRGAHEQSIQTFKKGIRLAGNNTELKIQFYSFLAESYRAAEQHEHSDEAFEKALELDPENIMILNNYSYYLALRDVRLDQAERMSKVTITRQPQNPTYLDTYAWVLFKMGKVKKALEYIESAIKYGADEDPEILEHYGDILLALGRQSEAIQSWKLAIKYGGGKEDLKQKINQEKR